MSPLILALALCVGGTPQHPIPDPCINRTPSETYYVSAKTGAIACVKPDCRDVTKGRRK